MNETGNNGAPGPLITSEDTELQTRMLRIMGASVLIAAAIAVIVGPWRIATGVVLGGALSLLNFQWLRSSIAALIDSNAHGVPVRSSAGRYLLRYFVIVAACWFCYELKLVSLPATIAGLCSFVIALGVEALRQFYFAFMNREEPG